jgi:hypothetical protein
MTAFAGYGNTVAYLESMDLGANAWNAGGGFRYLVARLLGLQMGIDVARGAVPGEQTLADSYGRRNYWRQKIIFGIS